MQQKIPEPLLPTSDRRTRTEAIAVVVGIGLVCANILTEKFGINTHSWTHIILNVLSLATIATIALFAPPLARGTERPFRLFAAAGMLFPILAAVGTYLASKASDSPLVAIASFMISLAFILFWVLPYAFVQAYAGIRRMARGDLSAFDLLQLVIWIFVPIGLFFALVHGLRLDSYN